MTQAHSFIPAVHQILATQAGREAVAVYGHQETLLTVRDSITRLRNTITPCAPVSDKNATASSIAREALDTLAVRNTPAMKQVFNMTGTILHTNLGRAVYAPAARAAADRAMSAPLALEYDLDTGKRGHRDDAVQDLVKEITGAEAACLVNNNASAILLVLAALAADRETIVSRGELIEIGGSFRMPDIMQSAGTQLREVGTTNRTHLRDYETAITDRTALLLKVHTSNYMVNGFTKETTVRDLAPLARGRNLPLVDDMGSGVLVDLARWGLPHERTVQEALAEGADLVTFSGDKLLGGPQAGFIAGRKDLVERCSKHPLKRALRLDKVRLAALEATLMLYRNPDRLAETLPAIGYFARRPDDMRSMAEALCAALAAHLPTAHRPEIAASRAQIGSGAMPLDTMDSLAVRIPAMGRSADRIARALRDLPRPVISRIANDAVWLDLKCLDDLDGLLAQIPDLVID